MLDAQRKKISFDVKELSKFIYGNEQNLNKFNQMQTIIANDPILKFNPQYIQQSRKELIQVYSKILLRYHQLFGDTEFSRKFKRLWFQEQLPLILHYGMFLTTLQTQCTEQQLKQFYVPANKGEIFGCYAQTQLSHGSDVQSLQTTATYNKESQQFVINTPNIESSKWWIGDLGIFADHAVVIAQLIIQGKKFGTHTFLVNIRDRKTHQALPGIQVGDIGPKYGFQTKDNGFLRFNNVKVPRMNMLMKYSTVSKDGKYQRRGNEKLGYATMLLTRGILPRYSFFSISQACVITTRYSLLRKQFKNQDNQQIQIFDYQLQRQKIIPYIAQSYAIWFGHNYIEKLSISIVKEANQNKFTHLNQTHALASGLKAIWTGDTIKALEVLRLSAGGHGFSKYSALPTLLAETAPGPTFEGQNTILFLQTARFLLKTLEEIQKGINIGFSVKYLQRVLKINNYKVLLNNEQDILNHNNLFQIYENNSYLTLLTAKEKLQKGINIGLSYKQSWDYYAGLELTKAAISYCYYWSYRNLVQSINMIKDPKISNIMNKLASIYGINKILAQNVAIYENEILTGAQFKILFKGKEKLLEDLRDQALGLAQAFSYHDNTLKSAIGRSDGKPYEYLLQWARKYNRVNREQTKQQLIKILNQSKAQIKLKLSSKL